MKLLENLELTGKLIAENIAAQNQLETIKIANNKTRIVDWYIALGFIVGMILAFILLMGEMLLIQLFGTDSKTGTENLVQNTLFIGLINVVTITGSIFFMVKLFQKIGSRHREKVVRRRFEKSYAQIEALNNSINRSFNQCEQITLLPKKYWNIQCVKKLKEYIENKRADTLKEALNLFEDELIKKQQMQVLNGISILQNQMVQAQMQTNREIAWQSFLISMKR